MAEPDKTRQALQIAIQMELDGKAFYSEASRKSSDPLGKELLRTLADEEDTHRRKFAEIYQAVEDKKPWPRTDFRPDSGQHLRTIFSRAAEKLSSTREVASGEINAVNIALDMENKSYDFYISQSETAAEGPEQQFYQMISGEEKEHYLVLLDYYEYLQNPAGWFVKKEHPSLDGG